MQYQSIDSVVLSPAERLDALFVGWAKEASLRGDGAFAHYIGLIREDLKKYGMPMSLLDEQRLVRIVSSGEIHNLLVST